MWTDEERLRLKAVDDAIHQRREEAVELADQFRLKFEGTNDFVKLAYAIWRKAVALRLSKREEEAAQLFAVAYNTAIDARAFVIAAYIQGDWAAIYRHSDPGKARAFLYRSTHTLRQAMEEGAVAPDPVRSISADCAFYEAQLAENLYAMGQRSSARRYVRGAIAVLKQETRGGAERYRQAYILSLWSSVQVRDRVLRCLLMAGIKTILWRRKRTLRILISHRS